MKYYRGKYIIGIYAPLEEGETLLGLCDNVSEFAELLGITKLNASSILNYLFHKKTNFIRFEKKCCSVEFIPWNND